jgi:glycine/D-amino acid oxidase-like deaminating enzyme
VWTDEKEVTAQTVIIATGAVAKRLPFKGSDEVRHTERPKGAAAAVQPGAGLGQCMGLDLGGLLIKAGACSRGRS